MKTTNRRKNLFYVACAFALVGLGACANDQQVEEAIPSPVIPGTEGMVSVSIPVTSGEYADGMEGTRAQEAPVTFTQDWGNGTIVETTVTPTPKTRAATIATGVCVLVVVCDATSGDPLSYELSKVDAGELSFSVPSEGTFNLVFYSENGTETIDPGAFINSVTGGVATPVTDTGLNTPHKPGEGATFAFGTGKAITASGAAQPVDAMAAYLGYASVGSLSSVSFKHVFAKLTWTVVVDAVDANEQDVPAVTTLLGTSSAGFSPHYGEATLNLGGVAASGVPWTPTGDALVHRESDDAGRGIPFTYTYDENAETDSTSWTTLFIPELGAAVVGDPSLLTPTIHVDSMTFICSTYGEYGVSNKTITISGPAGFNNFEAGKYYTVKSKIKKEVSRISAVKWAASNIYYDADSETLTFDKVDIPGVSHMRPGLMFRWGSLVGISVKHSANGLFPGTVVYQPDSENDAGGDNRTFERVTNAVWDNIPYNDVDFDGVGNLRTEYGVGNRGMKGEICAYITNGEWRMPLSSDFPPQMRPNSGTYRPISPEDTGYGYVGFTDIYPMYADESGFTPFLEANLAYVAIDGELAILPGVGTRNGSTGTLAGMQSPGNIIPAVPSIFYWLGESKLVPPEATLGSREAYGFFVDVFNSISAGASRYWQYANAVRCVKD
jgi:hypothetical protein